MQTQRAFGWNLGVVESYSSGGEEANKLCAKHSQRRRTKRNEVKTPCARVRASTRSKEDAARSDGQVGGVPEALGPAHETALAERSGTTTRHSGRAAKGGATANATFDYAVERWNRPGLIVVGQRGDRSWRCRCRIAAVPSFEFRPRHLARASETFRAKEPSHGGHCS